MNKILFLICFLLIQSFSVHAAKEKKFSYCGGNLKFYIPALFDKKSIEKQGEPYTCKYGFILKNKKGNKKTKLDIYLESGIIDLKIMDEEYLKKYDKKGVRHLFSSFQYIGLNGTATILTHRWVNNFGVLKMIRKDYYFGKKDSISALVIYEADPNNPDDVLFMSALDQLFLSMEIDW